MFEFQTVSRLRPELEYMDFSALLRTDRTTSVRFAQVGILVLLLLSVASLLFAPLLIRQDMNGYPVQSVNQRHTFMGIGSLARPEFALPSTGDWSFVSRLSASAISC